jgi:ferredoxin/flavodoxin
MKHSENNSTLLFLFSGTGNSLNVAIRIQKSIGNCEILSIPKVLDEKNYNYEAPKIGLIFPVHFQNAPFIVRRLLKNIKITGNPYVFAVATSGGEFGKTFQSINELLDNQNRALHSEFSIVLPSNSIIMENRSSTPEEIDRLINDSEVRINEIIEIVANEGIEKHTYKKSSFKDRFGCLMGAFFLYRIFNDRGFRVDNEKCVRCGTCVSVCPLSNIKITEDKVTYNHSCECCLACIHWCPLNAIEHFKTRGIPRYHHPHIKVKHMRDYISRP